MLKLTWSWHAFAELSPFQLYDLLALREQVFTFEQTCTLPDIDNIDQQSLHLLAYDGDVLAVYGRIVPPITNKPVSFGRLVVAPNYRRQGLARIATEKIMTHLVKHYPDQLIKISAQAYLTKFYQEFGFKSVGELYDEGGIDHISMLYETT